MKVLIVEENPSLRSMMKSILELGHADVAETDRGANALSAYSTYRPDWVLIDMTLKGSNGLEATERLRKSFPEARVMLVTDLDSLTLRQKAREAGVEGILVKDTLFKDLERTHFVLSKNIRTDLKR